MRDLFSHWQQLNTWLIQHRPFWQDAPFLSPVQAWHKRFPALADWLSQQNAEACRTWHADPDALSEVLLSLLPSLAQRADLIALPPRELTARPSPSLLTDTPQRKSQQAQHLVAALAPMSIPIADWCCGKGHLARALAAASDQPVTGLELDAELVGAGNALARRFDVAVSLQQQDVLTYDCAPHDPPHLVALHACGALHQKLLQQAYAPSVQRISFSPCCYRAHNARITPFSSRVRAQPSTLTLTQEQVRLMVRETVTAPGRVRALREQANSWRLGFDGLQRMLRQTDNYLPLPSHPQALMHGDFAGFCQWAANLRDLTLPANTDFAHWQHYGEKRLLEVSQQELLRHLFSRPLELWRVLDYALFLEEQGLAVEISTFCPRTLTPRNILVDARRRPHLVAGATGCPQSAVG